MVGYLRRCLHHRAAAAPGALAFSAKQGIRPADGDARQRNRGSRCAAAGLLLSQADTPSPSESIIYFKVDDIQKTYDTLKSKGVEFINAPHLIHRHADGTEEWMSFFRDLESRPLALIAQAR